VAGCGIGATGAAGIVAGAAGPAVVPRRREGDPRVGGATLAGNVLPGYEIGGDWFDYTEHLRGT
jgi:hypothetical protein